MVGRVIVLSVKVGLGMMGIWIVGVKSKRAEKAAGMVSAAIMSTSVKEESSSMDGIRSGASGLGVEVGKAEDEVVRISGPCVVLVMAGRVTEGWMMAGRGDCDWILTGRTDGDSTVAGRAEGDWMVSGRGAGF